MNQLSQYGQLGVGGLIVLLCFRELLRFLEKRKNGKNSASSGERTVEFWHSQITTITTECLKGSVIPILANQTEILKSLASGQTDLAKEVFKLTYRAEQRSG